MLVWSINLLQLVGALRIQCLLVKRLLRLPGVVQEVDIALVEGLSRLTNCPLLYTDLPKLTAQCAQALCLLLANAVLLRGQLTNALCLPL